MSDSGEFDLEIALSGHPVVLRDGSKAYVKYFERDLPVHHSALLGYIEQDCEENPYYPSTWAEDGKYLRTISDGKDIVGMWKGEPLPCPFCGSWEIELESAHGGQVFKAECYDCGAEGPSRRSESEAIEVWNKAIRSNSS